MGKNRQEQIRRQKELKPFLKALKKASSWVDKFERKKKWQAAIDTCDDVISIAVILDKFEKVEEFSMRQQKLRRCARGRSAGVSTMPATRVRI